MDSSIITEDIEIRSDPTQHWDKKKRRITYSIFFAVISGVIGFIFIYTLYLNQIQQEVANQEMLIPLSIVISIRITILGSMSTFIYYSWLKKSEQVYLSDAKFLFGTFFLVISFGKAFDLFMYLTNKVILDPIERLVILKVRFILIALNLLPMLYLGLFILLYSRHEKNPKLANKDYLEKRRNQIMALVLGIIFLGVILATSEEMVMNLLPLMLFPSLITIVYVFYIAHKQKVLSEVNPLIIMLGFISYLISSIIRPLLFNIENLNGYGIITEIVDIVIFCVIFMGFIRISK